MRIDGVAAEFTNSSPDRIGVQLFAKYLECVWAVSDREVSTIRNNVTGDRVRLRSDLHNGLPSLQDTDYVDSNCNNTETDQNSDHVNLLVSLGIHPLVACMILTHIHDTYAYS